MTRYFVLPYRQGSEGAKMLAEALPDGKRLRLENSSYTYQEGDCVINWGYGNSTEHYGILEGALLNPNVDVCINKRDFFSRMQGHNIVPPFAFSRDEAIRHLSFPVLCRTTVEGADGSGIVVANNETELVNARLYTQLMDKTAEYRIHLGRMPSGDVVQIATQKKRVGLSHERGVIWCGAHVYLDWISFSEVPEPVWLTTKRAFELMPELTFGGFDVIDTASWGARVLEVNSAPMLTPAAARKYAEFFTDYVNERDSQLNSYPAGEDYPETEDSCASLEYQRGYADGRREMFELWRTQMRHIEEEL